MRIFSVAFFAPVAILIHHRATAASTPCSCSVTDSSGFSTDITIEQSQMETCSLDLAALGCGTAADCQVGCNCDCGFAWCRCSEGDSGWNCMSEFQEMCECTMSGSQGSSTISAVDRDTVESCELNVDAEGFCSFVNCSVAECSCCSNYANYCYFNSVNETFSSSPMDTSSFALPFAYLFLSTATFLALPLFGCM